ncbi:FecR domain-containing protein [Haloferula sp. A504]|uniref:FecR domain-containing protein n=1 Tax=Haloferula sp. A504 TaxID=3373601 RepID=UPI0031C1C62E|nr:FecR domain-containing protein [Verrucomicrobiaceae bacterium E54]
MIPPDLQPQMLRMLDGELSVGELAALEAELEVNPEARKAWQKLSRLHSALEVHYESQANIAKLPVVPIDRVLARQRRRVLKTSLLAAAAVLVISAAALWVKTIPSSAVTIASIHVAPNSAFSLTHTGDGEAPMGNALAEGSRIVLEHGVAELELPYQVRAVIEAPAAITLVDDRTLQLDHGRGFFHVPTEEGRGFTVRTPHQQIVDLGTAFGIDASRKRTELDLHVFEGRVRVDALDGTEGEIITATRSVRLAGTRVDRDLDGPPVAFFRQLPAKVETLLQEDFESGLVGGREYAIRMDSTAIRDLAGNRFRGIDDDTTWNFSITSATPNIITPTSVSTDGGSTNTVLIDTINSSGLSGGGTSGDILSETHDDGGGQWISGNETSPNFEIIFDLGGTFAVDSVHLWNFRWGNQVVHWGVESMDISFSSDGGESYGNLVNDLVFAQNALNVPTPAQTRTFPTVSGVTHIKLTDLHYHGSPYVGFAEIRFGGSSGGGGNDHADGIDDYDAGTETGIGDDPDGDGIDSGVDTFPPVLMALHPADEASNAVPGGPLRMVFNEPIKLGTGRIFLRNISDWSEREIAVGSARTSVEGRVLTIYPPADLPDGERSVSRISGRESETRIGLINPSGDGTWYAGEGLKDQGRERGTVGSMRGPLMAALGPGAGIRREIGTIAPDHHYTVSAAIGVRDDEAEAKASFLGYTIRLLSGDTILAELSDDTPPGPPNSVTSVGFSWDSSTLPEGLAPGAPLAIEIAPNQASGLEPGYLDLDHVRVTVVGE